MRNKIYKCVSVVCLCVWVSLFDKAIQFSCLTTWVNFYYTIWAMIFMVQTVKIISD